MNVFIPSFSKAMYNTLTHYHSTGCISHIAHDRLPHGIIGAGKKPWEASSPVALDLG